MCVYWKGVKWEGGGTSTCLWPVLLSCSGRDPEPRILCSLCPFRLPPPPPHTHTQFDLLIHRDKQREGGQQGRARTLSFVSQVHGYTPQQQQLVGELEERAAQTVAAAAAAGANGEGTATGEARRGTARSGSGGNTPLPPRAWCNAVVPAAQPSLLPLPSPWPLPQLHTPGASGQRWHTFNAF